MGKLREGLTYANVVSSLALFAVVAGGTAYAANEWTGANIVDGTIHSVDIKDETIKSWDVANSTVAGGGLVGADIRPDSLGGPQINETTLNGIQLRERIKLGDGTGSGLDADSVDGMDFSDFDATHVMHIAGPLPRQGGFISNGGTLIFSFSGSGFRSSGTSLKEGLIGMRVLLDGVPEAFVEVFTNEQDSHKAFVTGFAVVSHLSAGWHTIRLEERYDTANCNTAHEARGNVCTNTDGNDRFRVVLTEIPD